MNAIFLATASCSPTGRPHCTRSADHSLAIFSASLPAAAQLAGSDSRPVLSVVRAIFRPWPSWPIRFAAGTTTSWNLVTPFSRPRRPMNALRRSTVMPVGAALDDERGDAAAVALALRHPGHDDEQVGDDAVGRPELDAVQHVLDPSSDGVAVVFSLAGSEPTSGSVSRKALISPRAHRGRYCCFCSSVPNSASGCGTPIDWCADSSAATAGDADPTIIRARL